MSIILPVCQSVKPAADAGELAAAWRQHKLMSQEIASRLISIGYYSRGDRMSVCSDTIHYTYCANCGAWHVDRAMLCRDRLCPTCQWRLALKRYATMQDVVRPLVPMGLSWALVTLTVRNCNPDELGITVDAIMQAWHRLLQRKDMRASLGWARGLEITYNRDSGQVHPHMHLLVCWPADQDRGESLRAAWLACARRAGLVVDSQAQHSAVVEASEDGDLTKSILETYKYSVKGSDLLDMPASTLREVARHWGGRRLMALSGLLRPHNDPDLDVPDADDAIRVCRSCGSPVLDDYLARWSMGEHTYRLVRLADSLPPLSERPAADQSAVRPPDMPVLLHTINGDVIMYPGGGVTTL